MPPRRPPTPPRRPPTGGYDDADCSPQACPPVASLGRGEKPLRQLYYYSRTVSFSCGLATDNRDQIVASVPAAGAIDVYIRSHDPGSAPGPGGAETWGIYAVTRQNRSQVGITVRGDSASAGNEGLVGACIFSIRDVPADTFELVVNGATNENIVLTFDIVMVGWAKEPTGIGPIELSTFQVGATPPATTSKFGGIPIFGRNATGPTWTTLAQNFVTAGPPSSSEGGLRAFNSLPMAQYVTAAPTLLNGYLATLYCDVNGNLKVTLPSTVSLGPFPAATALADADANPTTTRIGSNSLFYNGATWDRGRSGVITAATPTGWQNGLASGVYNSSAPTLTTGQAITHQLDVNGNLKSREQYAAAAEDNSNAVIATAFRPLAVAAYTWSPIFSTALAAKLIIKASAGTIRMIDGRIDATATTGTYYVQVWNLTDVPADATAISAGNSLRAPLKIGRAHV